jgi:hypothetical protein
MIPKSRQRFSEQIMRKQDLLPLGCHSSLAIKAPPGGGAYDK